jgi:acyl-CoA dehydrogenase
MDFSLPEELAMVRDTLREFVQNELVPIEQYVLVREKGGTRGAPIPRDQYERLKKLAVEQGLWGMTVPEALGGGGLNTLGACLAAEELGKSFVAFDFGDLPPMLLDANAEQQGKYVAPLVAGEKECRLALREPEANGSTELHTRADRDGDGWRLNGAKLAEEADLWLVFAQAKEGATCFIVERGASGLSYRDGVLTLDNVPSPSSAPRSRRATSWWARSRRRARRSSRRKRSCCARSSARRLRT